MGDEYPIRSDADAEYLRKLAKYVEEKIMNVSSKSKLPQQLKSEVLAALLIADEYFTEKEKNAEIEGKLQHLLSVLEENLEKERKE
jgi:cell division protein ZapA